MTSMKKFAKVCKCMQKLSKNMQKFTQVWHKTAKVDKGTKKFSKEKKACKSLKEYGKLYFKKIKEKKQMYNKKRLQTLKRHIFVGRVRKKIQYNTKK